MPSPIHLFSSDLKAAIGSLRFDGWEMKIGLDVNGPDHCKTQSREEKSWISLRDIRNPVKLILARISADHRSKASKYL
jgi:hypothetical protein